MEPKRPPEEPPDEADVFAAPLGRAIKVIRTGLGMDRKRLASAAGLSYSYLAEIENGRKPASASAQHAIARALGISPSVLLAAAEEWAARMREGELPLFLEEPHTAYWQVAPERTTSSGRTAGDRGARARQRRWFHAPAAPTSPQTSSSRDGVRSLERDVRQLRRLLESLSPEDRELVLELARRLARE